jgi:hypothetical protein
MCTEYYLPLINFTRKKVDYVMTALLIALCQKYRIQRIISSKGPSQNILDADSYNDIYNPGFLLCSTKQWEQPQTMCP